MAQILLAEDDKSMLNFLVIALERAGHNITATENGSDALEALNNNDDFDLLLTDIVMPGIDGIELAQKATDKYPNIKVMFITGFAAIAMEKYNLNENDNSNKDAQMLSKPFHLNDLVEQVEEMLSHSK